MSELRKTVSNELLDGDCTKPVPWNGDSMNWRQIIGSPYCDLPAGRKMILTILARYGGQYGNDIFPSQRELAFCAVVATKTVTQAMQGAESEGWIIRHEAGTRQSYKRHTYQLAVPQGEKWTPKIGQCYKVESDLTKKDSKRWLNDVIFRQSSKQK